MEGEFLSFVSYKEVDGKKLPTSLLVLSVEVEVQIPDRIHAPEEVLRRPPNAYDVMPAKKQKQLNQLAVIYGYIAEQAFDLWVRTLRWKSGDGSICRPKFTGYESGWATYLIADSSRKKIWALHGSSHIPVAEKKVVTTSEIWKNVSQALQIGSFPPIHIELLFDGIEHMKLGDVQRGTLDLAMACEVYLRRLFTKSLPSALTKAVKKHLDETNIRSVRTRFIPELLNDEDRQSLVKIESTLEKLFKMRNAIVHTGRSVGVGVDDFNKFLDATRKLFLVGNSDEKYR